MQKNTCSGIFFVLLSAYAGYRAYGFGLGDLFSPGPGFMFFGAALLLGALGLHMTLASILRKKGPAGERGENRAWRILPVSAVLVIYIVLFKPLGYLLSTFLFLFFLFGMRTGGGRHWLLATAGSAVAALAMYFVFAKLFALSLPSGLIYF